MYIRLDVAAKLLDS